MTSLGHFTVAWLPTLRVQLQNKPTFSFNYSKTSTRPARPLDLHSGSTCIVSYVNSNEQHSIKISRKKNTQYGTPGWGFTPVKVCILRNTSHWLENKFLYLFLLQTGMGTNIRKRKKRTKICEAALCFKNCWLRFTHVKLCILPKKRNHRLWFIALKLWWFQKIWNAINWLVITGVKSCWHFFCWW